MHQSQTRARNAVVTLCLAVFMCQAKAQEPLVSSSSQEASVAAAAPLVVKHPLFETTLSLGAAAQLTATRITTSPQALDPSATVLGSVRQSFRPWLGYTANFGYTRTTEQNPQATFYPPSNFPIPSNVYEVSVAYLAQKRVTPKLTGFADLGGGVLTFLPVHRGPSAKEFVPGENFSRVPSVLFRQLGVAGVGVDYHFNARLALRAEYRGLLYKYPDFQGAVGRQITVSSQPTVSLTYTFGRGRGLR